MQHSGVLLILMCSSVPWRLDGGADGSSDKLAIGMVSTLLFQCFSTLQLQIISSQEGSQEDHGQPTQEDSRGRSSSLLEGFTNMLADHYEAQNLQPCRSKEWTKLTSILSAFAAEVMNTILKH